MGIEGLLRAVIDADDAGACRVQYPALTLRYPLLRMDVRADLLAFRYTDQHVLLIAGGDDRGAPALLGDLGGKELCPHPARAEGASGTLCIGEDLGGYLIDLAKQPHVLVLLRISGIDTVDIRKEHKKIRVDLAGYVGAEPVIIPEVASNLRCRDNVILVEDGDHAHGKQHRYRLPEVIVADAIIEDRAGDENLGA